MAEKGLPRRIPLFNKLIKKYNIKYLIYKCIDDYSISYLSKLNTKLIVVHHALFIGNFYNEGFFKTLWKFPFSK